MTAVLRYGTLLHSLSRRGVGSRVAVFVISLVRSAFLGRRRALGWGGGGHDEPQGERTGTVLCVYRHDPESSQAINE